jgi:hypothetical protein
VANLDDSDFFFLPSLPHPRRVDRIPPIAKLPSDCQSVVPVLKADHRPSETLAGSMPLPQPEDHHLGI